MDISLKLNETKKFNKHYNFSVGSGHASLALRKDYYEQLKFIHDSLGIKQVRFHGIFDDDMNVYTKLSDILPVVGASRFSEYNFERIGQIYDNILEIGMKPFVELGFMPKNLASDLNQRVLFFYSAYSSMPNSDEEWTKFIQAFITFLINRYGKEEIESWYFEVWNEPDLIIFFGGSQTDYFHLYEVTAKAIKKIDCNIRVGGPSTSGSKWIKEFVQFVKTNNVPCDFISTHQYAGDPIGKIDGMELSHEESEEEFDLFSNPNIFKDVPDGSVLDGLRHVFIDKSETENLRNDTIVINATQVKKDCLGLPLYYTEWNENATFSAYTNDTRKVAAYIVLTSLRLEDIVTGSSVWCFSDIFEELHMFSEEFHGGFGLLTHNGIPKPSYYALKFLNEIGDERFIIPDTYGEITCGAFRDNDGNIQLLMTRQNMKNLSTEALNCNITVDFKPSRITVSSITEDSGNPLKLYEKLNSPRYLSKQEIQNIKEESSVLEKTLESIIDSNTTSFKLSFFINDVYLIKLYK